MGDGLVCSAYYIYGRSLCLNPDSFKKRVHCKFLRGQYQMHKVILDIRTYVHGDS